MNTFKTLIRKSDGQWMTIDSINGITECSIPQKYFASIEELKLIVVPEPIDWSLYSLEEVAVIPVSDMKELLKQAFMAGEDHANDCTCGECDFCIKVKNEDAPDFEKWYEISNL